MNLAQLKKAFVDAGCVRLYVKTLADNDNSKNQIYFGPGFYAVNLFPNDGIYPDSSPKNPILKAKLCFGWLTSDGNIKSAPDAQLILYPQYPEVRFSGFLRGCQNAPSDLMRVRLAGRILFLGISGDRRIIGFVVGPESEIAREFRSLGLQPDSGVFCELPLPLVLAKADPEETLLSELRRIHLLGWIDSKQLSEDGTIGPCNAPQCGGFTLEAELGIPKNSKAEPDFLGWEIKQHSVANFERIETGVITLMTPEPTGGAYKRYGPERFVREYGYADKLGRSDRLNFGGIHRVGTRHPGTDLKLELHGFDAVKAKMTDSAGFIALVTCNGGIAASWDFAGLLAHWTRKHSKAAYIPSLCRTDPQRQYAYGHKIRLAQNTDFLLFLRAMAAGIIYYDPGIKVEMASTAPRVKRRSQFRIASKHIPSIYQRVRVVTL